MSFYNEVDDYTNFVASFTADPKLDFSVYARGYWLAAESLSKQLLQRPHFPDYEAYPIVFLYRHALELSLKHVIYAGVQLSGFIHQVELDGSLRNKHDIKELADSVSDILAKLFPDDTSLREVCARLRVTCYELSEIDPGSYSYRYPIDTKGHPSTGRQQIVSLRSFAHRMSSILEDLDSIHFGLDIETDRAEEVFEIIRRLIGRDYSQGVSIEEAG